jgi:hypothetical protein
MWWGRPKSVLTAVPLLREDDDERLGPANGPNGEPLGRPPRKSKEHVFGPQREAGLKALELF